MGQMTRRTTYRLHTRHLSCLAGLRNATAEAVRTRKEFNRPQKGRKRELEPAMDWYLINAGSFTGRSLMSGLRTTLPVKKFL